MDTICKDIHSVISRELTPADCIYIARTSKLLYKIYVEIIDAINETGAKTLYLKLHPRASSEFALFLTAGIIGSDLINFKRMLRSKDQNILRFSVHICVDLKKYLRDGILFRINLLLSLRGVDKLMEILSPLENV